MDWNAFRRGLLLLTVSAVGVLALTRAGAWAESAMAGGMPVTPVSALEQAGDVLPAFDANAHDAPRVIASPEIPLAQTSAEARAAHDASRMIPITYLKGSVSSQSGRYILGPGDKIDMKIRDLAEFDQRFDIRPDGYASIHPYGEFYVAGSDLAGLQTWLQEKFKFYLREPQVTLSVAELRPALIYVSGEVRRPGAYQFIRQGQNNSTVASELQEKMELTLANVIKRAGGLTPLSDIRQIRVTHSMTGTQEDYDILDLLVRGQNRDIWLMPGDTVSVPAAPTPMAADTFAMVCRSTFYDASFPVVVLGAVEKQGQVQMDPNNNSLNAAIALAGGFKVYSHEREVLIQRPTNHGGFSQLRVDRRTVNTPLMAGDVVYVADSKLAPLRDGLQLFSQMTQPFFFVTGGVSNVNNLTK